MYKFWLSVCVIIILVQTQNISGDLSIDQRIREGNRKRALDVRLVGGSSSLEGRIEIRYNNTWGTVCDNKFNKKAAKVICHMLGYQRAGAKADKRATYGTGKGPIWIDKLRCKGNEISVKDCRHLPWGSHSCRHKDDAGVKCKAKKKVERDRMTTLELDMVVEENNKHKIFHRYNYNKNAAKDTSKRWNRGTIFYVFGAGIDSNAAHLIRDALEEWEYFSCLHFSKDVHNEQYNRIVFTSNQDDKGCASTYVGMKQGKQEIHLGKNCLYRDIILHEVGHALGFHHEHNRADRDRFIKVHDENIEQGYEDSFQKMKPNDYEDFDKPYDYKSIMHYGQYFFSKNESKRHITMETLNYTFQNVIGNAKHPSFLDYKILNIMYECSAGCYDVPCSDDGFLGKQCRCYCEGEDDNKPVVPCFQKDECQNPSINPYLFEVLDKRNWTEENINLTFYPDKTVFNLFSKNSKCSLASQLQCDNGIWIGKIPDCPVELEIQSFGCSQNEGIIEVILNGERGLICDDNWDDNDATVACRMMGFEFGKARFENNSKANESLPILLDEVKCSGHESMLSECEHSDWGKHDCDHSEVAAVTCFANRRTKHVDVLSNNDCGKIPLKGFKRRKREERVVGGFEASAGSYPWQVGIQRWVKERWIHWCGGTIISSHWILSAAHCYRDLTRKHDGRNRKVNYEDFRVHIGDHDLTKHENHEKRFQIEYLVKHWQFERDRTHPIHDVALLKINSSVVFNDYVQPACLPGENDQLNYGMKCEVSGWGKRNESGDFSDKLLAAEVPIVDEKKCKDFLERYPIDSQGMFCAGEIYIDACQGDSGGPLVCDMNDKNTVIGIISWGKGCGQHNAPGVYTNVAAYVSWIKEQISLHESGSNCPVLMSPNNGEVIVEGRKVGDKARFRCYEGFILEGSQTVTCQQGGRWDGTFMPVCKTQFRRGKSGLDIVLLVDISSSIGDKSLAIAKKFMKLLVDIYGVSDKATGGKNGTRFALVTFSDDADIIFNLDDKKARSKETVKASIDAIQNTGGGKDFRKALFKVSSGIFMTKIRFAADESRWKDATRAVFLITDGEDTSTLKSNKVERIKSLADRLKFDMSSEIFAIGVGLNIDKFVLSEIASTPHIEHVFPLAHLKDIERVGDIIGERNIDYGQCGISGRTYIPLGSHTAAKGAWPWLGWLSVVSEGMLPRTCGGAIVCDRWFLTAASCVSKVEDNVVIPFNASQINVYLKDYNIYMMDEEEIWPVVKDVLIHDNYTGEEIGTFGIRANDVALLDLGECVTERPVFNKLLRPICFPTGDTSVGIAKGRLQVMMSLPHLYDAYTAGWGHAQDIADHTDILFSEMRQNRRPVQKRKVCRGLYGDLDLDRFFCVGDEFQESDSCVGDVGGPYMVQLPNNRYYSLGLALNTRNCTQRDQFSIFLNLLHPTVSEWVASILDGCNRVEELHK